MQYGRLHDSPREKSLPATNDRYENEKRHGHPIATKEREGTVRHGGRSLQQGKQEPGSGHYEVKRLLEKTLVQVIDRSALLKPSATLSKVSHTTTLLYAPKVHNSALKAVIAKRCGPHDCAKP
jgi:hypothetical protein